MMGASGGVLIAAGGTGGHVFPALAVAKMLVERGVPVHWLGTSDSFEARHVPAAGIALSCIDMQGARGRGIGAWMSLPWRLSLALWQSLAVLRRLRPGCVLGMGGFAAFPGSLMAWLTGCPLVIHEQNAVAGLANRWLARVARCALSGMPDSFSQRVDARYVGNPTRAEIRALRERPTPGPESPESSIVRLLVIGGSRGAWALNRYVPAALAALPDSAQVQVRHQSGEADCEAVARRYRELGIDAQVAVFIDDMADAYRWADLTVCRAGALTLAELAVVGLGAVLVPFPHASDDHQRANARWFAEAGAGMLVSQDACASGALNDALSALIEDPGRCVAMANAARALGHVDATEKVVAACMEQLR